MRYLRRTIDPQQQYRRWIDPRVRTLNREAVIAYLEERGWKRLPPDRPGLEAFQEPGGKEVEGRPVCQFIPDSESYDTYPLLMFELVTGSGVPVRDVLASDGWPEVFSSVNGLTVYDRIKFAGYLAFNQLRIKTFVI